jgi:hypothetical protein
MGESASAADTSGPAQAFSEIVFSEDEGDGEYQDLGDSGVDESDEQSESESEPEEEQEHERDLGDVEVGEDSDHSDTDMDQSEEDEDMLHQLSLLLPHRVPRPTSHHDHEFEAGEAKQNPTNWNGRGSVDSDRDVIDADLTLIDGSDSSVIDLNPDYIDEIHVRTAPRANSAPPPRIVQTRDFRTLVPGDEIRIGVAGPHFTLSSPSLTTFISHHLIPLCPNILTIQELAQPVLSVASHSTLRTRPFKSSTSPAVATTSLDISVSARLLAVEWGIPSDAHCAVRSGSVCVSTS